MKNRWQTINCAASLQETEAMLYLYSSAAHNIKLCGFYGRNAYRFRFEMFAIQTLYIIWRYSVRNRQGYKRTSALCSPEKQGIRTQNCRAAMRDTSTSTFNRFGKCTLQYSIRNEFTTHRHKKILSWIEHMLHVLYIPAVNLEHSSVMLIRPLGLRVPWKMCHHTNHPLRQVGGGGGW
jgi:hypothetical protein